MKKITKTIEVCETCEYEDPAGEIECIICSKKGCDRCHEYTIIGSTCKKCFNKHKDSFVDMSETLRSFRNRQQRTYSSLILSKGKKLLEKLKK